MYFAWLSFYSHCTASLTQPGLTFSYSDEAILMELADWTDADLISVHEKLHSWCAQRQAPTWVNRFWRLMGYIGAFAFITGLTDVFFGGITGLNAFLMLLGAVTCFSWYKGDKQRKKNMEFLEKLDKELARRGLKT
jgi:hypothetical protein